MCYFFSALLLLLLLLMNIIICNIWFVYHSHFNLGWCEFARVDDVSFFIIPFRSCIFHSSTVINSVPADCVEGNRRRKNILFTISTGISIKIKALLFLCITNKNKSKYSIRTLIDTMCIKFGKYTTSHSLKSETLGICRKAIDLVRCLSQWRSCGKVSSAKYLFGTW